MPVESGCHLAFTLGNCSGVSIWHEWWIKGVQRSERGNVRFRFRVKGFEGFPLRPALCLLTNPDPHWANNEYWLGFTGLFALANVCCFFQEKLRRFCVRQRIKKGDCGNQFNYMRLEINRTQMKTHNSGLNATLIWSDEQLIIAYQIAGWMPWDNSLPFE